MRRPILMMRSVSTNVLSSCPNTPAAAMGALRSGEMAGKRQTHISTANIAAGIVFTHGHLAGRDNITPNQYKNSLSKWMNIALISGVGFIVAVGGELECGLPAIVAAVLLGATVFLPAAIFLFMPAPGPDRRLASESFLQFNREILSLVRRREIVIVLLLFLSPCSTFTLTNLLGGLGADFHASARAVSLAGGVGAFVPGPLGCFLFPVITRRVRFRWFYFANGILGCLFNLSVVVLSHTPLTFALAVFGEFLFQAIAFSIQIGLVFEAIGPDNRLAATTFSTSPPPPTSPSPTSHSSTDARIPSEASHVCFSRMPRSEPQPAR